MRKEKNKRDTKRRKKGREEQEINIFFTYLKQTTHWPYLYNTEPFNKITSMTVMFH